MMDVLLTTKQRFPIQYQLNLLMNAGAAYRRWQFNDRDSISDKVGRRFRRAIYYPVSEYSTVNPDLPRGFQAPQVSFNLIMIQGSNIPGGDIATTDLSVALRNKKEDM